MPGHPTDRGAGLARRRHQYDRAVRPACSGCATGAPPYSSPIDAAATPQIAWHDSVGGARRDARLSTLDSAALLHLALQIGVRIGDRDFELRDAPIEDRVRIFYCELRHLHSTTSVIVLTDDERIKADQDITSATNALTIGSIDK